MTRTWSRDPRLGTVVGLSGWGDADRPADGREGRDAGQRPLRAAQADTRLCNKPLGEISAQVTAAGPAVVMAVLAWTVRPRGRGWGGGQDPGDPPCVIYCRLAGSHGIATPPPLMARPICRCPHSKGAASPPYPTRVGGGLVYASAVSDEGDTTGEPSLASAVAPPSDPTGPLFGDPRSIGAPVPAGTG